MEGRTIEAVTLLVGPGGLEGFEKRPCQGFRAKKQEPKKVPLLADIIRHIDMYRLQESRSHVPASKSCRGSAWKLMQETSPTLFL